MDLNQTYVSKNSQNKINCCGEIVGEHIINVKK